MKYGRNFSFEFSILKFKISFKIVTECLREQKGFIVKTEYCMWTQ